MNGISSYTKDALTAIVESLFDRMTMRLLGNIPQLKNKKLMVFDANPTLTLAHLFVQSMGGSSIGSKESEVMKNLLSTAHGYIDALKSSTKTRLAERVDALIKEAKSKGDLPLENDLKNAIAQELIAAGNHFKTISEAEATKARNLGKAVNIAQVATSQGVDDPTVLFVVVKDNVTCSECIRLHLLSDKKTPRLWKLSELGFTYHKKGEDNAKINGLHPHCFTGDTFLHTSSGLKTLKELFESQEPINVYVDNRVRNRKYPANQFGEDVPGEVWYHRHSSGTRAMPAVPVYDTGVQECLKITLSNGIELKVSLGHEMWIDDGKSGLKVKASELKINDKVPLNSGECGFGKDSFPEMAELMGNLIGDGTIGTTASWNFFGADIDYGKSLFEKAKKISPKTHTWGKELTVYPPNEKYKVYRANFSSNGLCKIFKEKYGLSKKPRHVPKAIFTANKATISAFLRGLYAADGHSEGTPSVVLAQNDLQFLKEIQILLSNFGINSTIAAHGEPCKKKIRYSNGDCFLTKRRACWRLIIGGWEQCAVFAKEIGLGVFEKQSKLLERLSKTEGKDLHGAWRTAKVVAIENIGHQQTYCTTEPMTNTVTANGVVTGNCRCTLTYLAPGFGFKNGIATFISLNHDEYKKQKGEL